MNSLIHEPITSWIIVCWYSGCSRLFHIKIVPHYDKSMFSRLSFFYSGRRRPFPDEHPETNWNQYKIMSVYLEICGFPWYFPKHPGTNISLSIPFSPLALDTISFLPRSSFSSCFLLKLLSYSKSHPHIFCFVYVYKYVKVFLVCSAYIYAYMYIHKRTNTYMYIHPWIYIYICIYKYMYTQMHINTYIYIYVCIYIYVDIHICM